MSKVLQVVIYKSVSDEEKLAKYAALALPAMEKAGAKFLARGLPVAVREEGQNTRTVVIEWPSIEAADRAEFIAPAFPIARVGTGIPAGI